jgi:hypothetical protein
MMVKVRQGMAITKVINPVLVGACFFFFSQLDRYVLVLEHFGVPFQGL